ncbi:MAG TPA: Nif3-like dinuclear metal center hexameric protein [Puia sp.]|nr:Nif3-like dinuclear metal center hexameric protein [Puia sp.]
MSIRRREFLTTALTALAGSSLLMMPHPALAGSDERQEELTIRQVIDRMLADIPGAPFGQTVDTVKSGNINQPVKGIVTTMFATDTVIEKTIQLGANFIIAHEPTFYNHSDETDWLKDDKVFLAKKALLDQHGIVVWRFHDYLHAHRPDGVLMGVLTAMGWLPYYNQQEPHLLTVPAIPLGDVIKKAKKQLGIPKVKVIGNLTQSCKRIVISPGAAGGRSQIGQLQKYQPDLLIVGELNEWETPEYIRDARHLGVKMSLLVLGHSASEEPGLQWVVAWLQNKVPGIKITHIPSGDPFSWI